MKVEITSLFIKPKSVIRLKSTKKNETFSIFSPLVTVSFGILLP